MIRQKFDELAEKYRAGESSPEENAFVKKWAELHFRRHSEHSVFASEDEAQKTRERLLGKIRVTAEIPGKGWALRRTKWFLTGAAACLIAASFCGFLLWDMQTRESSGTSAIGIETKNTMPSSRQIALPDGSTAMLEPGASLVTDDNYGKQNRTVYLTGEAFFDVEPNAQSPFFVYTGELVTEVLGTSFRIKPKGDKKTIEVSVMTGKVSVYTGSTGLDKKRIGVIATPNQKVIYDTELKTLRNDLVDTPKIVASDVWEPDFRFDEIPLEKVLTLMQRTYGIEIVVGNPVLNHCAFTGNLNGLDLYKQLDIVCDVIGAQYEIRGTTVFVSGESCKGY